MEEKMKEIAECSICTDLFTDPRMLPCIHTFCLKCLNETSINSEKKPGDSMQCPICRDTFVIPKEGIDGLKKNIFMEKLVEVTKISKYSENAVSCEICTEDNEEELTSIPQASQYCIQCQQSICNRCVKEHKRMKLLKEHQLILIGSPVKEEFIKKFGIQYCAQHSTETEKLYCIDCKQIICMLCFAEGHKSHECSDINKAGDTFREEILNDLKQMKNFSQEAFEKYQKIEKGQNEFELRVEVIENSIIDRAKELKELIDKSTTLLLNELTSIKQNELKQFEIEKEEAERHRATVENLELYLNELVSKGSSAELCRIVNDLHSRNEDLHKYHRHNIRQKVSSTEIFFKSSNFEGFLKMKNIVGIITVKLRTKSDETPEVQQRKVIENLEQNIPLHIAENTWKQVLEKPLKRELSTEELYKNLRDILNNLTPQTLQTVIEQVKILPINTQERLAGCVDIIFEKAISEPISSFAYAKMASCLTTELYKILRDILNNLTPQTVQTVIEQVKILPINTQERLVRCVDIIFEKAISEPISSFAYAKMASCLSTITVPILTDPTRTISFRDLLLKKCQQEFEKDKVEKLDLQILESQIATTISDEKRRALSEQHDELMMLLHREKLRSLGNIRFVGELFKFKMLTVQIMGDCMGKLLKCYKDEDSMECLCQLLTIIGKDIDREKPGNTIMNKYFTKLQELVDQKKTSARIRFMIQDLIEQRKAF